MKKQLILLFFAAAASWAQSPTYYTSGVNSPWMAGIDYDLGFGGFVSYHLGLLGGVSSQVDKAASFGDVYFGELQAGFRLYLNKLDTWEGTYLFMAGRLGIYDLPLREKDNPIIFSRITALQLGLGIYLGYRWQRNLVNNMKDFPFIMAFEPFIGYTADAFFPLTGPTHTPSRIIHRFSIGLRFTLGFYSRYYRPGTRITNQETGKITSKDQSTESTNAGGGVSTNTNTSTKASLKTKENLQAVWFRQPLGKDPWDQLLSENRCFKV